MDTEKIIEAACLDELEKMGAAYGRLRIAKSRSGRRSISVSNFLKKEKDGSLYKNTGNQNKIAQVEPFLAGQLTGAEARQPRKKGELPSRESQENQPVPKREDGRDNATTVMGPSIFVTASSPQ